MEGAAVRGRYMRTFVAAVERVPEGPRILGPHADWTSKIERAGPLDWLPGGLVSAVVAVVGNDPARWTTAGASGRATWTSGSCGRSTIEPHRRAVTFTKQPIVPWCV